MITGTIEGERLNEPFPYIVGSRFLSDSGAVSVRDWLEREACWNLVEADFYEQYEIDLQAASLPEAVRELRAEDTLKRLRIFLETTFSVELGSKVDITAHRLEEGQRIRIHNDFIPGAETHRLIIQLNHGWGDESGGLLLLFNSDNPTDIHRILKPVHNSYIAFEISTKSFHAVSAVRGNAKRHTLVYSFYEARAK